MNHNEEDTLDLFNRVLERLHQTDGNNPGSIVFNIYEKGSMHDQPNPCSTKTHRSLPCSVSIIMMSYVRPSRHGDLISSAMTQA